ncbi:M20 family metallopeptidase [Oleiharenicola lentus]|uniref:M20 family metallopeptidase n=1 Tax=Oleiharenicola lentus TaxID=2508720 RepID=UPI003F66F886
MPELPIPQTAEALLAQLVSFETVNQSFGGPAGGEQRLAAQIEQLAAHWGLKARRCPVANGEFNLLVTCEVSPEAEWLLFESHLDTVSLDGMSVPPLELTIKDGRLHGRGACDTKGTGASMLWAIKEYARTGGGTRNVGIVFSIDEEARMEGAQAFAKNELKEFLPKLRGIIVGEPTLLRPVVAHNGALRWRTITRGVAAHSADPTKGKSAISAMVRVIDALESKFIPLANKPFPLTGKAAASINVIRGGAAANIIPEYCEIVCDRRLVPGETATEVLAERDAALAGLTVEHDGEYLAPPLPPANSERLHAFISPALVAAGLDASQVGAPYATNASHYAAAGAQVLVIGPGSIAQAHTHDEWLDRKTFAQAVELYGAFLRLP